MDISTLQRDCEKCGGTGYIMTADRYGMTKTCPVCDGIGKILTDEGLDLMAFVIFWLDKLRINDDKSKEYIESSRHKLNKIIRELLD